MKYHQMMLTAACAVSMMPAALAAAPIAPAPVSAPAVTVEGTAVDLGGAAPYQENGVWMVPLRAVAGPMGYEVTWCPEDNGVLVADEAVKMNLTYGVDSYAGSGGGMGARPGGVGPPAAGPEPALPLQFDEGVQQIAVAALQQVPGLLIGETALLPQALYLFQCDLHAAALLSPLSFSHSIRYQGRKGI